MAVCCVVTCHTRFCDDAFVVANITQKSIAPLSLPQNLFGLLASNE